MLLTMFEITNIVRVGDKALLCVRPALENFRHDKIGKLDKRKKPFLHCGNDPKHTKHLLNYLTQEELILFIPYLTQMIEVLEERSANDDLLRGLISGIEGAKRIVTVLKLVANGNKVWHRKPKYKENNPYEEPPREQVKSE